MMLLIFGLLQFTDTEEIIQELIDWIIQQDPHAKIVVHGISMGAAVIQVKEAGHDKATEVLGDEYWDYVLAFIKKYE